MQIRGRTVIKAVAYGSLAWTVASQMGWDKKIKAVARSAVREAKKPHLQSVK